MSIYTISNDEFQVIHQRLSELFGSEPTEVDFGESTIQTIPRNSTPIKLFGEHNGMYGYTWDDRYPKPMLGKTHSEETKQKWSAKRKGIAPPNKGIPTSEETKQKLSVAKTGIPRPDIAASNKKRTGMKYKKTIKNHQSHPKVTYNDVP